MSGVQLLLARHALIACPWGFGELCDLIRSMSDVIDSVGELVRDPFLWLAHRLFPRDFLNLLVGTLEPASDENAYSRLYRGTAPAGIAIAGISATARIVRSAFDERAGGLTIAADNLLRFGGAVLVLGAPTPAPATGDGLPVGWQLLRLGTNVSTTLGTNTVRLLSSPSVFDADVSTRALVGRFIALLGLSTIPVFGFVFAIVLILVGIGVLYMAMIMVMRSIMLAFAVAAAPLCIATAAFDHRNRFFQWWLELFSGALMIPVVLGLTLSITAGFALRFDSAATSFLPVTGILLGGMWFAGKAVHQLTWRHFSHGGITGALTALSTTAMAAPGLAAQTATVLNATGHAPKAGGLLDSLAAMSRGRTAGASRERIAPDSASQAVPLAGQAAELASAAAAESRLAAAGASSGADFGTALAGGPGLPSAAIAGQFNRAAGAAIGRFAETPAGGAVVHDATAGLPTTTSMATRVATFARQVSADPVQSEAVASATLGSAMGGRLPDLAGVLLPSAHREPEPVG